jgi:hypothetical protein
MASDCGRAPPARGIATRGHGGLPRPVGREQIVTRRSPPQWTTETIDDTCAHAIHVHGCGCGAIAEPLGSDPRHAGEFQAVTFVDQACSNRVRAETTRQACFQPTGSEPNFVQVSRRPSRQHTHASPNRSRSHLHNSDVRWAIDRHSTGGMPFSDCFVPAHGFEYTPTRILNLTLLPIESRQQLTRRVRSHSEIPPPSHHRQTQP